MNLQQFHTDLDDIVQNDIFRPRFTGWLNDIILELTSEYEFPLLKLIRPITYYTYSDQWFYDMPSQQIAWVDSHAYSIGQYALDADGNVYQCVTAHTSAAPDQPLSGSSKWRIMWTENWTYHKKAVGARSMNYQYQPIPVAYDMAMVENLDPQHIDTGSMLQQIAVEGNSLGVYPLCTDQLQLYFYRKPIPMQNPSDVPDGIPEQFHCDVVVPRVVVRNFRIINQMAIRPLQKNIEYWERVMEDGINKMKTTIAKSKSINKRGG